MWSFRFQRLDCWKNDQRSLGGREKTQRKELRCQVGNDEAEGFVVKSMKVLLAPSMGKENGRLTAGLCTFRVIDRGKNEARRSSSRDRGHLEFLPDSAWMAAEDRESMMCGYSMGRWLIAQDEECEDAQRQWIVGKLVNEVVTSDVRNLLPGSEVRSGGVDRL